MLHYFKKVLFVHETGIKFKRLSRRKQEYMPLMKLCSGLVDKTISEMKKDYRRIVRELKEKSKSELYESIKFEGFTINPADCFLIVSLSSCVNTSK